MKNFKGKAIYNPSGKSGEYSYWACNFYNGCSNGCTYCYLKKGVLAHTLGGDRPTLKKCFKSTEHALEIFKKELLQNLPELQKYGLFFTFTSDPCLPDTIWLNSEAWHYCLQMGISVKILTKCAQFADNLVRHGLKEYYNYKNLVAIGYTLTGHDELEPHSSTNTERIDAMRKLSELGFKTWASIEPIIDFESSYKMIRDSISFCDMFKIGLESGKKYDKDLIRIFINNVIKYTEYIECFGYCECKLYFKDSLLRQAGIKREELPNNCVGRAYPFLEIRNRN
ncbi:MAG: hypothetical protein LBT04_08720 [Prevotellaceae bacterium]|nr:hypothetical protein [Prevotellaceae bacterium]